MWTHAFIYRTCALILSLNSDCMGFPYSQVYLTGDETSDESLAYFQVAQFYLLFVFA